MNLLGCILNRKGKVIRIKGTPSQYASFKRKTDAQRWIQQMQSALNHTLPRMRPSYDQLLAENERLRAENAELKALVQALQARIADLEARLNQTSKNSSTPLI